VRVLVDTSVWIRFLANKQPYADELDGLLARDEVLAHCLVYGELLVGDRGRRGKLLTAYAQIHHAAPVPHGEVVGFVETRRLNGRGISWIDAHLLASALVARAELWTADASLAEIAEELGVARARASS
jgi:hypothetical protein